MLSFSKKESKCVMIFKEEQRSVKLGNSLVSFEDCPNKCVDGYYVDPYTHRRRKCLYCAEKRKQLVKNEVELDSTKSINERLHIPETFVGYGEFNMDTVLSASERVNMTEESISEVSQILQSLIEQISVGVVPSYSMLFNLGKQSHSDNFINAYLVRAYMEGMSVAPYITASVLYGLRRLMLDESSKPLQSFIKTTGYDGVDYADYIERDICVIEVDNGCTYEEIASVQGLMQLRSKWGRPTLVFTNVLPSQVKCLNSMGEQRLDYGYYYSVKYQYNDTPIAHPNRGVGGSLSSNAFSSLTSSKNIL